MSVYDSTDFIAVDDGIRTKFNLPLTGGYVKVVGSVKYSEYRKVKDEIIYLGEGVDEITGIDGIEIINVPEKTINGFNYIIDNTIYSFCRKR